MTRFAAVVLVLFASAATPAMADVADDLAAVAPAIPTCDADRAHCFGLQIHIAADDSGLVVTPAWVAEQVANANRQFAPLGVGFQVAGVDALAASAVHIENRAARNALAAGKLTGTVIHVFLIRKLENVDDDIPVFGVTWHRPNEDRKYIIVGADAMPRTLAHELGHVFGLPHSTYAISIMNKTHRDKPAPEDRHFADEEIAAMKPGLARLLRDKVIADITSAPKSVP
jgi:hypothetical protein